ncbi:MAG: chromosomal replication initiator protein DnaA [Tannerella sp.]|jgi:chromosomal replication initiator protein|nr:chromosomal replication initiator protein DnaA [Tannerella sp.]
MQNNSEKLWKDCLTVIKDIVPQATFEVWFKPIIPLSYEDHEFTIQVPTKFFYEILEERYVDVLTKTLNRVFGEGTTLKYHVTVGGEHTEAPNGNHGVIIYPGEGPKTMVKQTSNKVDATKAPGPFKVASQDLDSQLNPRYNFENFFEGESNKLVRAVSERIALEPGKTAFNPLFIYGPSGVGKTHICHAIGVKIHELYPEKRTLYVSANLFRLQYTDAVRKNVTNDFISFYQSIDILILDDVHELIGLTKTQEIFFHIFKSLHQLRKQLILTCDRAPVNLQGMEDRLISRLKWGMTAQIERPDLELRKKILRNKIYHEGLEIPEDVFAFISENVTENVRNLEGVLVSLMANSVIANKEIDLTLAKQVISQTVRLEKKQLTIQKIQEVVCHYFNLDEALIHTKSRKREIVQARQITMYLAKKYTEASLAHIGKVVGGKDHATVLHSYKAVINLLETSKAFRLTMEAIEGCLK